MKLPEGKPNRKMTVLDQILAETRDGLPALRRRLPELERAAASAPSPAPFLAEAGELVALIAEVKRRSPSAGSINPRLDPVALAAAYHAGGAAAISVLTEPRYFGGSTADLVDVVSAVSLPVLRKDFIVDEAQLVEARALGASAALLIVRALTDAELRHLCSAGRALGLELLVEAHDALEVKRALDAGARVIGINARNLGDFTIDPSRALALVAALPPSVIAVAESGMATRDDVRVAAAAGADAVLIGGALARAQKPSVLATELAGVPRRGR